MRAPVFFTIALISAAGCFHPSYDHPACPDGECPDGLTCVAGVCESPSAHDASDDADGVPLDVAPPDVVTPSDASSTDRDNDTILNEVDNCPDVSNIAQANEDGDAFGDPCDPCPISTINTDTDNDGVGDMCDPNPASPNERMYLFEGFAGTTLPTSLAAQGIWNVVSGHAESSSGSMTSLLSYASSGTRETITTVATVTAFGSGGSNYAGISQNFESATTHGAFCSLVVANGGLGQHSLTLYESPSGGLSQNNDTPIVTGTQYKMVFLRDGALYRCSKDGTMISGTATGANATTPRGLLYIANSSARFEYLMVVKTL